ncbi:MAG: radical SAM protein, partial [Nanoarchaeota archaeon]
MLLINPPNKSGYTYPPLSLAYLASAVEQINEKVKVIDCQITPSYYRDIKESVKYDAERFVCIGANVSTSGEAIKIARFIRKVNPKIKIIMGGPYATTNYLELIPKTADIVVMGEGEDAIQELVKEKNLYKIRGIAFFDNIKNKLIVNRGREFIEKLDREPPAWHLFDIKQYYLPGTRRSPVLPIITSRGCPYRCLYCTKFIHGYKVRFRSIKNVIKELDYLKKIGVKEIIISDDNFTFNRKRTIDLCNAIIRRKYNFLFNIQYYGLRADRVDKKVLQKMYKAGFYTLSVAPESGVQEVVDKLGKNLNLGDVRRAVKEAKEIGFVTNAFFMIGLPFDTRETMEKTIKFAKELDTDTIQVNITQPFPGTPLYDWVKKHGRFLQDVNKGYDIYKSGRAVFETKNFKGKDVEEIFRKFYREFYFSPRGIIKLFKTRIRSLKEIIWLFK